MQDEKNASQDYLAQGQKVNFKEEHVRQTIRVHLMKAGFPQQKVDEVMGNVEHLPNELVTSFYEMLREDLKERISQDKDYKQAPKGRFDHLDKL